MTRLAELIEKRGTTIQELSRATGMNKRTVYRHVKGDTTPNIHQAVAYARALKVELSELAEDAA